MFWVFNYSPGAVSRVSLFHRSRTSIKVGNACVMTPTQTRQAVSQWTSYAYLLWAPALPETLELINTRAEPHLSQQKGACWSPMELVSSSSSPKHASTFDRTHFVKHKWKKWNIILKKFEEQIGWFLFFLNRQ